MNGNQDSANSLHVWTTYKILFGSKLLAICCTWYILDKKLLSSHCGINGHQDLTATDINDMFFILAAKI